MVWGLRAERSTRAVGVCEIRSKRPLRANKQTARVVHNETKNTGIFRHEHKSRANSELSRLGGALARHGY